MEMGRDSFLDGNATYTQNDVTITLQTSVEDGAPEVMGPISTRGSDTPTWYIRSGEMRIEQFRDGPDVLGYFRQPPMFNMFQNVQGAGCEHDGSDGMFRTASISPRVACISARMTCETKRTRQCTST